MNEILTPISDTIYQTPWNLRFTTFRLGPMFVHFVLKDMSKLPPSLTKEIEHLEDHRTGEGYQFKRYVIFCIMNEVHAYILSQYDSEIEAGEEFKNMVNELKEGNELEITDEAGIFESMQLSYRGIKWIWE